MPASVIFHWSTPKGFDTPHARKKLLSRWVLTCKAFGIHTLYCVTNDEEVKVGDAEVTFETFTTLENAKAVATGDLVLIEQGGRPLEEFKHPKDAVYVFGSDYGGLYEDGVVSIRSKLPVHAEVAAGIVLSHRYLQCP